MKRTIKIVVLTLVGATLLITAIIFFKPSIIINTNSLVWFLKSHGDVTYEDIDLKITSPSILDKEIRFAANDFCIKNEKADLCLPEVSIDIVFKITRNGIRITKIGKLIIENGNITFALSKRVKGDDEEKKDSRSPNIGMSLFFRALEMFSDLSRKDIGLLNMNDLSFSIKDRYIPMTGELNFRNDADALMFEASFHFLGQNISLTGDFNGGAKVEALYNGEPAISVATSENPYLEFMDYIRHKEIYLYKKKDLRARLDIGGVNDILKLFNADIDLPEPLGCDISLKLNEPDLGDATLTFEIADRVEVVYDFYQKIPAATILDPNADPSDRLLVFLSVAARMMGYHAEFYRDDGQLKVLVTRDYSKLPRKRY